MTLMFFVLLYIVQFVIETVVFGVVSSFCSKQTACVCHNMHSSLLVWHNDIATRTANSNLNSNSKKLGYFAELELKKILFLNSNLNSNKIARVHLKKIIRLEICRKNICCCSSRVN